MSEPSGVVVAGAVGVGMAGVLSGVNGEAAVGALFGALIYFTTTAELPLLRRVFFFVASFVMGYMFAPAIGEIEVMGARPFAFPGPAAFGASLLVVTISLAAINRRGLADGKGGGNDG
ncbi:putative holin [Pseudomonas indica]|uniref:Putative phage holin n=1 Tax=Pseudomonas indica TaxID=137658 RepID=A0A1G8V5W5_9PSED|nr:putative holin [Pseudomonas indica]SDJ60735.1 Putative phage holin [Pseudomonas indica]